MPEQYQSTKDLPPIDPQDPLYSARFNDYFANRIDPFHEKQFVFCHGNNLAERFRTADDFVIGELGFGAGLAFLATVMLWRETAKPDAWLDYLSVERFPLTAESLAAALCRFPQVDNIAPLLAKHFPANIPGTHRLEFPEWRVRLTLYVNDAVDVFSKLDTKIDAWYPDGFAPSKNPGMWTPELFHHMARLSYQETTLATYTAASQVRRDLASVGFSISKQPGFAGKRERIVAIFSPENRKVYKPAIRPWYRPHDYEATEKTIAVIGGGVAGCAAANRLAARGFNVRIYDRESEVAAVTSSNPAAIMKPYLTRDDSLPSRFFRQGYLYSLAHLAALKRKGIDSSFHQTGILTLAKNEDEAARFSAICGDLDPEQQYAELVNSTDRIRELAGEHCADSFNAMYFRDGGWLDVSSYCKALIEEYKNRIEFIPHSDIMEIQSTSTGHQLFFSNPELDTASHQTVVLASGSSLLDSSTTAYCNLTPNRGQISLLETPHSLQTSLSSTGYVIPQKNRLVFGSTYELGARETDIRESGHDYNCERLRANLGEKFSVLTNYQPTGWAGIRITSKDRLPVSGEIFDAETFGEIFQPVLHGEKRLEHALPPTISGLYITGSLGSRAVTSALLSAEIVASLIDNAPLPITSDLFEATHPARFLVRRLKKQEQ